MAVRFSILLFFLTAGMVHEGAAQTRRLIFPEGDSTTACRILQLGGDTLLSVYTVLQNNYHVLYARKSADNGTSWGVRTAIDTANYNSSSDVLPQFCILRMNSLQFILVFKGNDFYLNARKSGDAVTWGEKIQIPTQGATSISRRFNTNLSLAQTGGQSLALVYAYTQGGIYFTKSTDMGSSWSETRQLCWLAAHDPSFVAFSENNWLMAYRDTLIGKKAVYKKTSSDGGVNWSDSALVLSLPQDILNPELTKNNDGSIALYCQVKNNTALTAPFGIFNEDIALLKSTDGGVTWPQPQSITKYVGYDGNFVINALNGTARLVFQSQRYLPAGKTAFYCGKVDGQFDNTTPPVVSKYWAYGTVPLPPRVKICAAVDGQLPFTIHAKITGVADSIFLYDNGTHGDSVAQDRIFSAEYEPPLQVPDISYSFGVASSSGEYFAVPGSTFKNPLLDLNKARIFINRLNLPIDNKGNLANVNIVDPNPAVAGGTLKYDEGSVLFSGGFFLSGYKNGVLWANGMASSGLVADYQAGIIGSNPALASHMVYVVRASDPPFGASWQLWAEAVQKGARYYDGNNDNIYSPVDLNNNGQWDPNEDKPALMGDITAWCVYNDGVAQQLRRWNIPPQNIEIKQSVFGSRGSGIAAFHNTLFLRYSIVNKGTQRLDSVLFALNTDPDVGTHSDDLCGTDTISGSIFSYNKGTDQVYGNTTPAFFAKLVQGPPEYIAGRTFQDINSNGRYDPGIDIPLDTALNNLGTLFGSVRYPGARNAPLLSSMIFRGGDPDYTHPNNAVEARNYMLGLRRSGQQLDPCTSPLGTVTGVHCNQVNKRFVFSGDPVSNYGWINTSPTDIYEISSTGPFTLEPNQPVDIIAAYVVGRGTSNLNSITVAKEYAAAVHSSWKNNFADMPVGARDEEPLPPAGFALWQNYPNPFNPETIIKYGVGRKEYGEEALGNRQQALVGSKEYGVGREELVSLKVYDVLGREVATLVNEVQPAGEYTVRFNASRLPSGTYFYELRAGEFWTVKKMSVIK